MKDMFIISFVFKEEELTAKRLFVFEFHPINANGKINIVKEDHKCSENIIDITNFTNNLK